jgi:hypothetical protein
VDLPPLELYQLLVIALQLPAQMRLLGSIMQVHAEMANHVSMPMQMFVIQSPVLMLLMDIIILDQLLPRPNHPLVRLPSVTTLLMDTSMPKLVEVGKVVMELIPVFATF